MTLSLAEMADQTVAEANDFPDNAILEMSIEELHLNYKAANTTLIYWHDEFYKQQAGHKKDCENYEQEIQRLVVELKSYKNTLMQVTQNYENRLTCLRNSINAMVW